MAKKKLEIDLRPIRAQIKQIQAEMRGLWSAVERRAEGREGARADQADHLGVLLAVDLGLEQEALQQERVRDVVGGPLDLHRVAFAGRGPVGRLSRRHAGRP